MKTRLEHYLPEKSIDLVKSIIKDHTFHFKITKHRQSKFGDYRFDSRSNKHTITVNGTLNSYSFLITFLHEVAHLKVRLNYKPNVLPHGKEWKFEFAKLLGQSIRLDCYPEDIKNEVLNYMKNPAASSANSQPLYLVLRKYDEKSALPFLNSIEEGTFFIFRNKKYRKIAKRRTRSLCEEIGTGKRFLISEIAEVQPISEV